MNEYSYMISPSYCKNWTVREAIREILANALDTGTKVDMGWADGMAVVRDRGDGMAAKALLMGESTKTDNEIGQFGEGLKIAALVLARNGRKFSVRSNGSEYRFSLKESADFGTNILTVAVVNGLEHAHGTEARFGCSDAELNEARAMFLKFSPMPKYDDRVLDAPGKVYVKGLLTGSINSLFGYNFDDKTMMNRDRTVLDDYKVQNRVASALAYLRNEDAIEKYLVASTKVSLASKYEFRTWFQPQYSQVWKKMAYRVFGKKFCLSTGAADGRAEYLGYKVIAPHSSARQLLERLGSLTSETAAAKPKKKVNVKHDQLLVEEARNLEIAKKIGKAVCAKSGWWVQVTDAKGSTLGTRDANKITIERSQLRSVASAVDTILHELAHYESGHLDVSSGFEAKLCQYLGCLGEMLVNKGK